MSRLPVVDADNDSWGTVLNDFLGVAHNSDGTLQSGAAIAQTLVDAKGDLIVGTAADTAARKAVGVNGAALVADSTASDGLAWNVHPLWFPTYKSATYYFASPGTITTSTLANQAVRLAPGIITESVTIVRIGFEFTAAGEANSYVRLGIYADDGTGLPGGVPVLDAGTISTGSGNAGTVATGGTPGVYEITISTALTPGLYWWGGAVQNSPTTPPTIRVLNSVPMPVSSSSIPGAGNLHVGFQQTGVSGALPTWAGGTGPITIAPRIFFKTA